MTRTEPSTDMASFRKTLSTSKRIIAVAGAGLSAASGIPTFRGAGGLWRRFNATDLATPEAFEDNPNKVWQFYHYRRETVKKASVNNAHIALAEFSLQKTRDRLMPGNAGSTFTLITQNIDGLSRAALTDLDANTSAQSEPIHNNASEQPPLLEMHGRLFDVICTEHDRDHTTHNDKSPICPALLNTEVNSIDTKNEKQIPVSDLPRCETCGALARPGVVWFGEMPLYMDVIDSLVREAELCIVVGTSSTVYPAAGYAHSVKRRGGKVAVFNLERSSGDREADFLFFGACEETLPQALVIHPWVALKTLRLIFYDMTLGHVGHGGWKPLALAMF